MRTFTRFFAKYLTPLWTWYIGALVFLFATNWLAVEIPLRMAAGIDALGTDPDGVRNAALAIGAMGLAVIAVRTLSRVLFFTPGRLVEFHLKNDIFAHLTKLQPSFYAKIPAGDIVSRATNDISFVRALVGFGGLQIANVAMALALTGRKMYLLSPKLTLLTLAPVFVGLVVMQAGVFAMHRLTRRSQEELSTLSNRILSLLQGVQTIQDFTAEPAFLKRFEADNSRYMHTNISLAWLRSTLMPVLGLAGSACVYVLLVVGGPMARSGEVTVGVLVAFVTFIAQLLWPLMSLGWLASVVQRAYTSLVRIDEVLYAEPERPEGAVGEAPPEQAPDIELRDLSFTYPGEDAPALHDISAHIRGGSTLGIYGRTGAGKSTLLRLLTRSMNPPEGALLVGGRDIRSLDLGQWRDALAVAPQVPFLFSASISSNVAMGPPDPEGVQQATRLASLSEDLKALPEGLETVVGERGIMLSGGQRQRTALARALYREARIILLDDVLSAVDQETEQRLIDTFQSIGRQGERPTIVLVSHRMSALARTDHVLVLDEGRLVDQGTHAELLERPGPYREAWASQNDLPDPNQAPADTQPEGVQS
ncbi:MAG: ABC transporter ATP-binding protein [Myxococcota bacterium]|nr:ABC transporter ATP-binding protein [Myxococcota bacterium]